LLAVHVSTPENVSQIAVGGFVDLLGRDTLFAMIENANNHAGATLFFRAATFNADFHANLLKAMLGMKKECP
jgi:hypothetical protein